jgi:hypothetical protein
MSMFTLVINGEGYLITTSCTQEVHYTWSSFILRLQRTVNRILWRK